MVNYYNELKFIAFIVNYYNFTANFMAVNYRRVSPGEIHFAFIGHRRWRGEVEPGRFELDQTTGGVAFQLLTVGDRIVVVTAVRRSGIRRDGDPGAPRRAILLVRLFHVQRHVIFLQFRRRGRTLRFGRRFLITAPFDALQQNILHAALHDNKAGVGHDHVRFRTGALRRAQRVRVGHVELEEHFRPLFGNGGQDDVAREVAVLRQAAQLRVYAADVHFAGHVFRQRFGRLFFQVVRLLLLLLLFLRGRSPAPSGAADARVGGDLRLFARRVVHQQLAGDRVETKREQRDARQVLQIVQRRETDHLFDDGRLQNANVDLKTYSISWEDP